MHASNPNPNPKSRHTHPKYTQFDAWFPLFGVVSVAIFTLYLLFCVVAGNFKLGVRFLCIELHPMKARHGGLGDGWCLQCTEQDWLDTHDRPRPHPFFLSQKQINGTYMNSFLFNLILILLCTFPIVEFSTAVGVPSPQQ